MKKLEYCFENTMRLHCRKPMLLLVSSLFITLLLVEPQEDLTKPEITCPNVTSPIYAEAGKKGAVVKYPKAEATDNNKVARINQFTPKNLASGDRFPIKHHVIGFEAADKSGNVATCLFHIEVKAHTCHYRPAPGNGMVDCHSSRRDLQAGDVCSFGCYEGYELVGRKNHTCGENGTWEYETPLCKLTNCSAPSVPNRAVMESCTSGFEYNSVCIFTCEQGFDMAAGAQRSLRCGSKKQWIGSLGICQDTESPVITDCPQNQKAFVEYSSNYALVYWNPPTAIDNVDIILPVTLTEGLPPGSNFSFYPNNIHRIAYSAQDVAGNFAEECEFYVIVDGVSCPPIQHAFRLNITCPDGLGYGSKCTFQCDKGYPLVGPSEAFCDRNNDDPPTGYWNWGEYKESPFCEVVACPTLEPPLNGALACDDWLNGIMCQMQCNDNYDIPYISSAFQASMWVCSDTKGQWRPHAVVPDCSELRKGDTMRLPSRLYYFSGDCQSHDTQQQIRRNFIENLNNSHFRELCTLYDDCSVENVRIKCGKSPNKRDLTSFNSHNDRGIRNVVKVEITFDIVLNKVYDRTLPADAIFEKTSEQFDSLSSYMSHYVRDGGLDINGLTIDPTSLVHEEISLVCDYGTFPEYTTFTCRPCGSGSYYNGKNDTCTMCPAGTYQHKAGEFDCIKCPAGTTTFEAGAKKASQCIQKCMPGFYSTDGLFPCAPCAKDTYAEEEMQQSCKACPTGTYTARHGAHNVSDCVTEIIPTTPCANNPCNSHGVCIRKNESFTCACTSGYSGSLCDVAADPCSCHSCQNKASCVVIDGNGRAYTCKCPSGYFGSFCQHEKVDGSWNSWSGWSQCSTSCGDGRQMRIRHCDNPTPNEFGEDCAGPNVTSRVCKVADCPECSPLPRSYGASLECEQLQSTIKCTTMCLEGRISTEIKQSTFSCGPESNFLWSPEPSKDNMPACTETRFPSTVRQTTVVAFPVPSESQEDIEHFHNNAKHKVSLVTPCIHNGHCLMEFQDRGGFLNGQGTYNSTITIDGKVGEFNYMRHGIYDNETAIAGLMTLTRLLNDLDNIAVAFNNSFYDGSLNFTNRNGVVYFADVKSIKLIARSLCRPGESSMSLLCVNCPPGSYGDGIICALCPVGQYQELEGQERCHLCTNGYTTKEAGSVNITSCIPNPDDVEDDKAANSTHNRIILSSLVLLSATVIILIAVVILRLPSVRNYFVVQLNDENLAPSSVDTRGHYKHVTVTDSDRQEGREATSTRVSHKHVIVTDSNSHKTQEQRGQKGLPPSYEECMPTNNAAVVYREGAQMLPLLSQADGTTEGKTIVKSWNSKQHNYEISVEIDLEKNAIKT